MLYAGAAYYQSAQTYPEKLASKIDSSFRSTFRLYPDMQPTNNHTERELHRKVSGQIGSVNEMRRFGVLFMCLLTWRRRKLGIYRELDRILMVRAWFVPSQSAYTGSCSKVTVQPCLIDVSDQA